MAEVPVRTKEAAMQDLTIRKARAEDAKRIAEIIAGDPGQEAVAIAGCVEAAREFGMGWVRLPDSPQGWQRTTVAELDGEVVGIIQAGPPVNSFQVTPRVAWLALRILGVSLVTALPRLQARQRVQVDAPEGSYYIAELDVDPAHRNRGIGGALLDYAEAEARRLGHTHMALSTTTSNPARHLYERHGFRIAETKTDAAYERITGIAGRHLMVKELA
jgi:ribosomal protein S18 acetylase RimI-like enzyme